MEQMTRQRVYTELLAERSGTDRESFRKSYNRACRATEMEEPFTPAEAAADAAVTAAVETATKRGAKAGYYL